MLYGTDGANQPQIYFIPTCELLAGAQVPRQILRDPGGGSQFLSFTWSDVRTVERLRHRVQPGLDPGEAGQDGAAGLAVREVRQLQLIIGPADTAQ